MSDLNWSKLFSTRNSFVDPAEKTNKKNLNWSKLFSTNEISSPNFASISDAIGKLEYNGDKGLTARTNNKGAVLYTDELAQKYGAVKGPKLPSKDNPDNRELYTAIFPNKENGDKASMDVIKNIYNTSEGDIEKFASIYSMGLLPNQLITKEQNQIKDRYVKALSPFWQSEDISKTVTRKQNDVTQAVIDETLRLRDGGNILETDLENSNLFDITRIRELGSLQDTRDVNVVTDYNDKVITDYKGFQKEIATFSVGESTGVVNNFISQFENQDTVYIAKNKEFYDLLREHKTRKEITHPNDEKPLYELNPNNPTLIEKGLNDITAKKPSLSLSQAPPTISDLRKQGVPWAQAYRQVVGSNAPEGSFKKAMDTFLPSLQETFVGLGDFAQRLGEFAMSGRGGEQLWDDLTMGWRTGQNATMINDAILATVPLPYAYYESIGPEKVAQAKKNFAESPVPYIMSAMYLNPKAYLTLDVISKGALGQVKKKAQTISSNALKLIDKTPEQIAQYDRNTQAMVKHFQENPEVIPTVIENVTGKKAKDLVPFSKNIDAKSKTLKERQIESAQKEVSKLSESLANTEQSLRKIKEGELEATPLQINSLNKSRQNSINLIVKNLDIIGQDAFVSNLQGGFGLFKPDAKKFASYVRNVYNGVGAEVLDSKILTTMLGTSRPKDWVDTGKARTKSQKDLAEALSKNAEANSTRKSENSLTYKDFKNKLGKAIVDVSFVTDSFLEKIENSKNPELAKLAYQARRDKNLINGYTEEANIKLNQIDNDVYRNLNPTEREALDNYILARNERDLKIYQDEKVITLTEEKKGSPNAERLKEINAELKRIKNYEYAQDGKYLTSKNLDNDFRAITPLSDESFSKIKQGADIYFNEMKTIVDDLFDNNLITKTEANDLKARDYAPKQYIDKIAGKVEYKIGGKKRITYDNGYELQEGDKGALFADTEGLIKMVVTSSINKRYRNQANLTLRNLIRETDKTDFAIGYEIGKKKPLKDGFVEIKYRDENANVKSLAIAEDFADGWVTADPKQNIINNNALSWYSGTKILKASATGYNPVFAVTNIVRDMQYILLTQGNLYNNFLPYGVVQFGSDFAKSLPDFIGKKGSYLDWVNEGGATSLLSRSGGFEFYKHVRFDKGIKTFGKDLGTALKYSLGYFGEMSEVTSRLAVRRRALQNGMSSIDATFKSRSYLDFSRVGTQGRTIDNALPYFATSVQATRGYAKAWRKDPVKMAYKTGQLIALEEFIQSNYFSSEEGQEIYGKISPYDMYNNFTLPISYKHIDSNGQKKSTYLRLPKDSYQKIVSSAYAKLSNSYRGNPVYFDNKEFLENTLKAFTPLEFQSLAPSVHALIALATKNDAYGSKIYKGQPVLSKKDETNRDKIPEQLWIKDFTNIAPIDISPARMQYTVNRYVAKGNPWWSSLQNTYSSLRKNIDPSIIDYMDEEVQNKINNTKGIAPIVNRFVKPVNDYDYYENRKIEDVKKLKNGIREDNRATVDVFLMRFKDAKSKEEEQRLFNEYQEWETTVIPQRYGPEELTYIQDYYKQREALEFSDISKDFYKRLQSDPPYLRAYRLASHVFTESMTEEEEIRFIKPFQDLKGLKSKEFWLSYEIISSGIRQYGRGEGLKMAKRLMNVEEE